MSDAVNSVLEVQELTIQGVPTERLFLHPKQMEVHSHSARFKVIVAGRRWGKTSFSRVEMILFAINQPKRKIWYIAPTYRMAKQIMWDDLKDAIPKKWIRKVHETHMTITLKNGSIIECKGADKPDTLRGVGLHLVVLDEYQDMKADVWEKVIMPTLAQTRGKAVFIGTPKGFNNLYKVYVNGQNPMSGAWKSWQFKTISSPFVPEAEVEAMRLNMDPKSFAQEFEASFETMSGRVYYQFDRRVHVKKCEFNPNLPIWVGQDFNVDPMSTVIMQPQTNGEIWVIDEIYLHSSNTQEICEELERRYWRYKKNITIYPDPAGDNRSSSRGESDLDIFREAGFWRIKFRKKHPQRSDRFNAVNKMFKNARGEVKMYIDPKCKNLIESLEQTLYKIGTPDIDKGPSIEHASDALGYPIELEFPAPSKRIKLMGYSR